MHTVNDLGIYSLRDLTNYYEFCNIFQPVCEAIYDFLSLKSPFTDQASWDLQQSQPASPATTKMLVHYGQIIITGVFKQFDYGSDEENIKRYGSKEVPIIPLENISEELPIALYVGKNDTLADLKDVEWLNTQLGDRVVKLEEIDSFDHFSYAIGTNTEWSDDVINLLNEHHNATLF